MVTAPAIEPGFARLQMTPLLLHAKKLVDMALQFGGPSRSSLNWNSPPVTVHLIGLAATAGLPQMANNLMSAARGVKRSSRQRAAVAR